MIEFNDIDFYGHGPMPHHHHEGHRGPQMPPPPPMPPFDPELKRVFDLAAHADRVAHKALDVAGFASLDAASAKKLAEQTLSVLNKVSMVADKANVKSDRALSEIELLKDDITTLINELNATLNGAGLADDGSYIQDDSTNYITDATSLANADKRLDAKLKEVDSAVSSLSSDLDNLQNTIVALERRVTAIETLSTSIIESVGLETNGTYTNIDNRIARPGSNLKAAVKLVADEVVNLKDTVNSFDIDGLQEQVDTNTADIETLKTKDTELQTSINTLTETVGTIQDSDARQNRRIGNLENKVDSLNLVRRGLEYDLKIGEEVLGTIVIPEDKYVSNVSYDNVNKKIIFTYADNNRVEVPVNDLVDTYAAGNGISVSGNQISVVVSPDSEKNTNGVGFLTSIDNGIKIDGIKEEVNAAYVAGNGLIRTGRIQDDPHIIFAVQVEENTKPYLTAQPTGLRLDVDALKAEIGGGDQFDCARIVDCIMGSQTFNEWLTTKINQAVEAAMLWQVKAGQSNAIEPKPQYTEVHVSGAIYSGQD